MPRREYRHVKGRPEPNPNSDILDVRHDFAQKIGELAAHWNVLETNTLGVFTVVLAGEEEIAFELYYDVLKGDVGAAYKRDKALRIAIESRQIAEDALERITDFMREVDAVRKERNDVLHAMWASVEGSDSLFAAKDKIEWMRNNHAVIAYNLAIRKGLIDAPFVTGLIIRDFWEYRISDLQEIIDNIKRLCYRGDVLLRRISTLCFLKPVEPPWKRAESRLRHQHLVPPSDQSAPEAQPPEMLLDQPPSDYEES